MPRSLTTEAWSLKKLTLRERRGTLCSFGGRGQGSCFCAASGCYHGHAMLVAREGERGR